MSGVKQGERNNTIAKLAGQYIQKKLSREECLALLLMANERFDPPLGEKEVERTLDSIIAAHGRNHPANASESNLDFPLGVMGGVAGDFANLYSSYLESPPQFFFMAFLTCLGNVLSQTLCIDTEVEAQPRLYLVLLGQSADDRKSTSISKTVRFFKDAMMSGTFNVCWGIGSAEGLPDVLKSDKRLLLCFDEFKTFVAKSKIEGSVLLPCVNTLFESNRYEGRTKKLGVLIEDAYLSLMAASTVDTYENTWSSQFTDIGFNNRLFLVPGTGERKFAIPKPIPREEVARVAKGLGEILKHTNGNEMRLPISDAALKRYDLWYSTRESSVHARRLETYAMRLMSLLAINELRNRVDEEIVEKVITLCDWQLRVRKVHDPVDADNVVAKMEEKIRRQLRAHRTLTRRNLSRNTHANRDGTWVFETALTNLMDRSKEVGFDKKSNEYYLWNPLG